jgi:eight-cysteine-cluster-containing protein
MVVFGGKLVGSRLGLGALAASAGVLVLSHGSVAEACSCLPSTVESSYHQSSDVAAVTPLLGYRHGAERWYLARVSEVYKGCTEANDLVLLATPSSSASCGGQLEIGVKYLINAQRSGSVLGVAKLAFGSCQYNLPTGELDAHDREFLAGRSVCCGDECACVDGSALVQCFANPCDVTPACNDEALCEANYCGGCNAEFYDESGYAACQPAGECHTDADCMAGEWCRQAPESEPGEPTYECVPFVAAGGSCEGFTLPWFFERCAPGLVCDTPDFVADAPGTCRAPCSSLSDCPDGEYCASDGTCDSDGQCEITADCTLDGNTFIAPLCVGYPTCGAPEGCGWACGDPACMDTWGYDFGPCDAVLGFGMFGGACTTISGCDAGPLSLFETERACRDACEAAPPPECSSDADCAQTGCSGQVCAAETVFTTCEYRDEYACFQDPAVTACGCDAGRCGFDQTPELAACLDGAGAPALLP